MAEARFGSKAPYRSEAQLRRKFIAVLASTQGYRTRLWPRFSENGNILLDGRRILVDYRRAGGKTVSAENVLA
jgi:hypothetical protein